MENINLREKYLSHPTVFQPGNSRVSLSRNVSGIMGPITSTESTDRGIEPIILPFISYIEMRFYCSGDKSNFELFWRRIENPPSWLFNFSEGDVNQNKMTNEDKF